MNNLNLGDIEVSKKTFYESRIARKLDEVDVDHIDLIPLCILLLQMSGWIKYFENGGKTYIKYSSIWNKVKELLGGIKLYSERIYDDSYIKTKVKTFSDVIKTLFDGNKIPEERIEYLCITCISIDSILKVDKKNIHKFI